MEFNLRWNTNNVSLITNFDIPEIAGSAPTNYLISESDQQNKIYLTHSNGELEQRNLDGTLEQSFADFSREKIAQISLDSKEFAAGSIDSTLNIVSIDADGNTVRSSFNAPASISSNLGLLKISNTEFHVIIGTENGAVHRISVNTDLNQPLSLVETFQAFDNKPVEQVIFRQKEDGDLFAAGFSGNSFWVKGKSAVNYQDNFIKAAMGLDADGNSIIVALLENNRFLIIEEGGGIYSSFNIAKGNEIVNFSLAPLAAEKLHIVVPNGTQLDVYNLQGVLIDNYPFTLSGDNSSMTPVSFDLQNDQSAELLSITDKGVMNLVDNKAEEIKPFPVTVNSRVIATPVIVGASNDNSVKYLNLVTENNKLFVWQIENTEGEVFWSGEYGDNTNSALMQSEIVETHGEQFFPEAEAYNWPNPVYDEETHIRYRVNKNADVTVKIFDLGGELVAELEDKAVAGFDNETTWNVSNIESGVYFAHLELKSNTGKTAKKIIKIAVVK
jgi:hypothetical protein